MWPTQTFAPKNIEITSGRQECLPHGRGGMAKKLYMTTADYLVIAVSPALIMAMVGSLVYFLIAVFYEGDYPARLNYAFGLFVFAAVLVARISIEEGREYAS